MSGIPTKEIGELLEVVSDKLPRLIHELLRTLYSEEAGTQMGKGVGIFYKELVDAGIPAEDALAMAKDYMKTVQSIASNLGNSASTHSTHTYHNAP